MSVRCSLLAILDQGPCYGYQLRNEFAARTGGLRPVNVGQIYNTLDRLERDGRVVKTGKTGERGHVYYSITPAGHDEAAAWLASPVEDRGAAARDELVVKLAVAMTLPGVDAGAVIRTQRRAARAALAEATGRRDAAGGASIADLAARFVLEAAVLQAEAELRWLEVCEAELARARAEGRAAPMPLSTEVPRRGRPPVRDARTPAAR